MKKGDESVEYALVCETPVGPVCIRAAGKAITALSFGADSYGAEVRETPLLAKAREQLEAYFSGARKAFDLSLEPEGTPFQKNVYRALCGIPYGCTRTYGQIAAAVGNPRAARAVGMANHNNPIAIFIPCHRVIGADGSLTGYAGGLDKKERLLALEHANSRFFRYDDTGIRHLADADERLKAAIERIGPVERQLMPDAFSALVSSIVSQQISSGAANTVWQRLHARCGGEVTPQTVAALDVQALADAGMSGKKAGYILHAARAALEGELDFEALGRLSDEEVCRALTRLPGVGRWTAQMLLIFVFERPDVLSWDDFGIRRGFCLLTGAPIPDREEFELLRRKVSPYGTLASLYLWEIAGGR